VTLHRRRRHLRSLGGRVVSDPDPQGLSLRAIRIRGRLARTTLNTTVKLTARRGGSGAAVRRRSRRVPERAAMYLKSSALARAAELVGFDPARRRLVANTFGNHAVWGDVVIFAACRTACIGEVSGCRVRDLNTTNWVWTVRRQTTPSPGGLVDKGTKGQRTRAVPLIPKIHELTLQRVASTDGDPDARLFTGPRGGRITTAVLRDATSWDEVVTKLGHEHLRRHDLRHTGLTGMADVGIPIHHLRKIAGHVTHHRATVSPPRPRFRIQRSRAALEIPRDVHR
jgi:integrase